MSKARNLADLLSDGAELADGQISVAEVVGAAPLASPTFTGTASGTFSGPLTGNVTGDVTGDVTGNITGNVTGNVTGDVTAPEIDLSAISSTISDTAVDVFVYDTSKDSDGGAWRKRTQGTSWYNETLNTSTRGSRKEFPAVAVIVLENNKLTIYDGDDPSLPMWMVCNESTTSAWSWLGYDDQGTATATSALNGVLCITSKSGSQGRNGVCIVSFVSDDVVFVRQNAVGAWLQTVADRNNTPDLASTKYSEGILSSYANDVAMTVLPNAPIDAATGLPVPTIAVATNGGTSVICDNETVNGITHLTPHGTVTFFPNGDLFAHRQASTYYGYLVPASAYTAGDVTGAAYIVVVTTNTDDAGTDRFRSPTRIEAAEKFSDTGIAFKGPSNIGSSYPYTAVAGLSLADWYDVDVHTKGGLALRSLITSDYQTGWMPKDTKLATLSDTDDTDVTGSELVTNGTFDSGTTGWTADSGSTLSISAGELVVTTTGGYKGAYQAITVEVGRTYTYSVDETAGTPYHKIGYSVGSSDITHSVSSPLTTFTPTNATIYIWVGVNLNGAGTATFDNVTIRLAEEDRSVNGNGLQVFGTVTKNPVATGADLVDFRGWSGSNYLFQPYNSDLAVGTGDICVVLWYNANSLSGTTRWIVDQGATGFELALSSTTFFYNIGGGQVQYTYASTSKWNCAALVRRNGVLYAYMNGEEVGTASATGSVTATSGTFVGIRSNLDGNRIPDARLALLRISATAPSPEQIAKIYEDEKVLFQENAQATLYGSSDAVTALAYDDSTNLLHVGTSAGRSVFQGLRRVDNTTDAVGAAISASNGLVAED